MIVTLQELKDHLRIQDDAEDASLTMLLQSAQSAAEDYCLTLFSDPPPHPVRLAVMLMASHYYEYRDSPDRFAYRAMRMAFESLLWPHRDLSKLI